MVDIFGRYESQTTKQLRQIDSSKYPDTNKDVEANLVRVNQFIDYIAQYLQTMQKGIDQATQDPISRWRDTLFNFGALLGGGELLYGIDLGDLQYFLPALGAMFGFDSDQPFPINLLYAAEHFFLGFIVPLDSWNVVVGDMIDGWLTALGLDPAFITAFDDVLSEMAGLGTTLLDILNDLFDVLDIFGINTSGFGPFADIWHVVTVILGGFSLETLGNLIDPIFEALVPWMKVLQQFVALLNEFLSIFNVDTNNINSVGDYFGPLAPIFDDIIPLFENISNEVITAFRPVWDIMLGWTTPFAEVLSELIDAVDAAVSGPGSLIPMLDQMVQLFFDEGTGLISAVMNAIASWSSAFTTLLSEVINAFEDVSGGPGPFIELLQSISDMFSAINTATLKPILEALVEWTVPLIQSLVQITIPVIDMISSWSVPFLETMTSIIDAFSISSDFLSGFSVSSDHPLFGFVKSTSILFGNPVGLASGAPVLGPLASIPLLEPILAFVQNLIDVLIHAISGIPVVGGTIADVLSNFTGLVSDFGDTTTLANDTSGNLSALSFNLLNDPIEVIGNISKLVLDDIGGTVQSFLDSFLAGFSLSNTIFGGSTGGTTVHPPTTGGTTTTAFAAAATATTVFTQTAAVTQQIGANLNATAWAIFAPFTGWWT